MAAKAVKAAVVRLAVRSAARSRSRLTAGRRVCAAAHRPRQTFALRQRGGMDDVGDSAAPGYRSPTRVDHCAPNAAWALIFGVAPPGEMATHRRFEGLRSFVRNCSHCRSLPKSMVGKASCLFGCRATTRPAIAFEYSRRVWSENRVWLLVPISRPASENAGATLLSLPRVVRLRRSRPRTKSGARAARHPCRLTSRPGALTRLCRNRSPALRHCGDF